MPTVQRGFGRLCLLKIKLSHYLLFCPTVIKYQQGVLEMKKKNVIDLIRYHTEENDAGFRNVAYQVADEFSKDGDASLSEYIISLLSDASSFVPQESIKEYQSKYLEKIPVAGEVYVVEDTAEEPCAVIRLKDVKVIPFNQISWELAAQDGENENLKDWQDKQRAFFEEEADLCGFDFEEEMPVVCEIFELVYKSPL